MFRRQAGTGSIIVDPASTAALEGSYQCVARNQLGAAVTDLAVVRMAGASWLKVKVNKTLGYCRKSAMQPGRSPDPDPRLGPSPCLDPDLGVDSAGPDLREPATNRGPVTKCSYFISRQWQMPARLRLSCRASLIIVLVRPNLYSALCLAVLLLRLNLFGLQASSLLLGCRSN